MDSNMRQLHQLGLKVSLMCSLSKCRDFYLRKVRWSKRTICTRFLRPFIQIDSFIRIDRRFAKSERQSVFWERRFPCLRKAWNDTLTLMIVAILLNKPSLWSYISTLIKVKRSLWIQMVWRPQTWRISKFHCLCKIISNKLIKPFCHSYCKACNGRRKLWLHRDSLLSSRYKLKRIFLKTSILNWSKMHTPCTVFASMREMPTVDITTLT